jgi:5-deoxy-glucuronate isomerase
MVVRNEWFFPRGSLARDPWETVVDSALPGWPFTGLRVAGPGGELTLPAGDLERMIVPLTGDVRVSTEDARYDLTGRDSVFSGPADVLYLGAGTAARIAPGGRVAVAEAPTAVPLPPAVLRAADVPVEIRGAGRSTRQVHNFGTPGALAAAKLIVCEVITPAENWSSYPGHKHDEASDSESELEEIYYFETAVARGAGKRPEADPFGIFATTSSPAGAIETTALVRSGDVALVPYGYHGPAAAPPGYDLYYLNVMAGPGPRAWTITDDPAHAWLRDTWQRQDPDPRLPYRAEERS